MKDKDTKLLVWFSRQGEKTVQEVFSRADLDLNKLLEAAAEVRHLKEFSTRRKTAVPLDELEKVHELRFDRLKKDRKKRSSKKALKIEREYFLIKRLREKGGEWQDILEYLKRYKKLEVSLGYLFKILGELDEKYSKDS